MTITINGTTGITNDGGYTGDGVVFADTTPANTLVTTTGGLVGIGTSSPSVTQNTVGSTTYSGVGNGTALFQAAQTNTAADAGVLLGSINGNTPYVAATRLNGGAGAATPLTFYTDGSERARIDTSGNLLVAYSSGGPGAGPGIVKAAGYNTKAGFSAALSGNIFNIDWSGSTATLYIDTTNVGNISLTSDYRIKQKIETQIAPALERVMQLRPVTYELQDYGTLFKADGVAREGFIAHELQAVVPSAVEGEKDAPNQIQSLKLDALVSVLTKAIQEQQAIITAQAAQIQQLREKVLEVEEGTSNMLVENTNNLYETITALTARVAALEGTTNV